MTYVEVAEILERFVDGTGGRWDWDNYCATRFRNSYLQDMQDRLCALTDEFPPANGIGYCSPEGNAVILAYATELRRLNLSE
jgi:hypothetical protein